MPTSAFLCACIGALLVLVCSTQNNTDVKMEKLGQFFFQIGELKVPDLAQPFFLVLLDAKTMVRALNAVLSGRTWRCSSQKGNTLPPGQTFHLA